MDLDKLIEKLTAIQSRIKRTGMRDCVDDHLVFVNNNDRHRLFGIVNVELDHTGDIILITDN